MRWRYASATVALCVATAWCAVALSSSGTMAQGLTRSYPVGMDDNDPAEATAVPPVQLTRAYIPDAIDLSDRVPPPGDQGDIGACVSWATGYAARSYYNLLRSGAPVTDTQQIASPAYLHQHIRNQRKACKESGSSVLHAMAFLILHGVPSLADFGADAACDTHVPTRPNATLGFQIKDAYRIFDLSAGDRSPASLAIIDKIKQEIARGNPVVIGMMTDDRLQQLAGTQVYNAHLGVAGSPAVGDRGARGGHAMSIIGYDDHLQAVRVINSWGEQWGDRGYGWISYGSLRTDMREAYTMNAGITPPIPVPKRPTSPLNKQVACNAPDAKPWPVCEALETLAVPLAASSLPAIQTTSGRSTFHFGETVSLTVTAPDFPSFLYLVYLQADGKVVNLLPRRGGMRQQTPPRMTLTFGDGEQGRTRFRAGPPQGTEMVIAIGARSPIAELEALEMDAPIYQVAVSTKNPVDQSESPPDRAFLSALRTGLLSRPDPNMLAREVSAAVLHLTIEP